jgi:hypothetical protein
MAAPVGGPVGRQGAQDEARRELARGVYGHHQPGWLRRAVGWINHELSRIFGWLNPHGHVSGPHYAGLGVFAGLLVVAVLAVVLRLWLGPVRRGANGRREADTELASPLSPTALRAEAEEHARAGRFAEAVRSRLRAVVRMVEEKGVLVPRPSRTAGELVAELAATSATDMAELRLAVTVFSDIWYGGRPAGLDDYQAVVRADEALTDVRRGSGPPSQPTHVVPA